MLKISDLTYKVLSYEDFEQVNSRDCVIWANEMIVLGYESPNLFMLASFCEPTTYSDIRSYFLNTVSELGFQLLKEDYATLGYCLYYAKLIVDGENVRMNLKQIYEFNMLKEQEIVLSNFQSLYYAWDDLDYEDNGNNHYWDGARRNNIQRKVIQEADKWVSANESTLHNRVDGSASVN